MVNAVETQIHYRSREIDRPPYLLDDTRTKVLLDFYDHTRKAITHYSDLGWRIQGYVLILFSAAITLVMNPEFAKLLGPISRTLFSGGIILVVAVSTYFIVHCQQKLATHRVR